MPGSCHPCQHTVQLRLRAVHLLFFLQEPRDQVLNTASLRQAGTEPPPDETLALGL